RALECVNVRPPRREGSHAAGPILDSKTVTAHQPRERTADGHARKARCPGTRTTAGWGRGARGAPAHFPRTTLPPPRGRPGRMRGKHAKGARLREAGQLPAPARGQGGGLIEMELNRNLRQRLQAGLAARLGAVPLVRIPSGRESNPRPASAIGRPTSDGSRVRY